MYPDLAVLNFLLTYFNIIQHQQHNGIVHILLLIVLTSDCSFILLISRCCPIFNYLDYTVDWMAISGWLQLGNPYTDACKYPRIVDIQEWWAWKLVLDVPSSIIKSVRKEINKSLCIVWSSFVLIWYLTTTLLFCFFVGW